VKLDAGTWTAVTGSTREFTALAEGAHTVSVRVTDNAGNSVTIGVTFMVDTVDPSLSITSPEAAWETEDRAVTVTWTCTDTGCGIDRIEVCIDGGAFTTVGTVSERIFSDLEAGEHTVDVRAYDKAGNMVEESVVFTVNEGGGISALLIGGIVLAIIVLVAAAVILMRRKKTPAPPMQE
ncbi:MAG: Ig-like domain-containing protein, partial [Thermoplasmata archaeon]|nr:Ig-like domain-containing protein [Thermoplasmata archaeon]